MSDCAYKLTPLQYHWEEPEKLVRLLAGKV